MTLERKHYPKREGRREIFLNTHFNLCVCGDWEAQHTGINFFLNICSGTLSKGKCKKCICPKYEFMECITPRQRIKKYPKER